METLVVQAPTIPTMVVESPPEVQGNIVLEVVPIIVDEGTTHILS